MTRHAIAFMLIVVALLAMRSSAIVTAGVPIPLKQQVSRADVILVGTVGDIESKRYCLNLCKPNTDGKEVSMYTWYDLAKVHSERVLKIVYPETINKVDASNPKAWVHLAFPTPGGSNMENDRPTARKDERRIWFARRDMILTGNYFLDHVEEATDEKVQEVERLIAEAGK